MAAIDRVTTQGGSRNAALRETNQTAIIVRLLRKAQVMGVRDAICGENLQAAVNLAGAQRDWGVQGLRGPGVGGTGQAAAVSPATSFQTANRRVIWVR